MENEQTFRLLLGLAGVAFGAIQLYFRSELKALALLREQVDKLELRFDTYKESVKNLFQTHVGWVQKEINRLMEKCEVHRKLQADDRQRIDSNTQLDRNEIIKLSGEIKLVKQQLERIEQFFYESRSLWDSKADIIADIENLKLQVEEIEMKLKELEKRNES
jgi:chromosome segregation ATPase